MANKYKTLDVGSIFTYKGNKYKVCRGDTVHYPCSKCAFNEINCDTIKVIRGNCTAISRIGHTQVYYEQINNETMKKDSGNAVCPALNTNNSLNDLHVECPKGYSIDVEHSDLSKGIIKFKKDNITLEDIYDNQGKDTFVTNVVNNNRPTYDKIAAIATLMDIANYYNKDWNYNVTKEEDIGYVIVYDGSIKSPNYSIRKIEACSNIYYGNIIFKNEADAQYVIDNPNFKDVLDNIFKS